MNTLYIVHAINLSKRQIVKRKIRKINDKTISEKLILKEVAFFTGISSEDIKSKNRKREITDARAIFTVFVKKYKRKSLAAAGSIVSLNHSTVLYNEKKCDFVLKEEFTQFENYMINKYPDLKLKPLKNEK